MLTNSSLKLFSKYLLVGISALVLLFTAQQAQLSTVYAEKCQDKQTGAEIPCPVDAPAPAPVTETEDCFRCAAGASWCEKYTVTKGTCSTNCNSCPAQGAAPAAPACPSGGLVKTDQRCVGNQMCKINTHTEANCSQYEGGFYDCQNSAACGFQDRRGCNDACTSNSQCNNDDAGRACIGGFCRLSSNPSSINCSPPAPAAPTRLGCNDACTSDSQCNNDDAGRGCVSGFCRLRSNPSSINCSPPAQVAVQPPVVAPAAPAPVCVPNGTCSAAAPACGQTTTGVDNCNNSCNRQGAACGAPPVQNVTLQCPNGTPIIVVAGETVNMNTLCQVQQQAQQQSIGPITVTAQGGSATGGSVTINNPAPVVLTASGNVGVATTAQVLAVQQLPKTGLPVLAWTALAFIPAGFRLRKFSRVEKALENHPSYIHEARQFNKSLTQ